ncbi:cytochrome b/b6 domain-containing protein [Ramlibacter tataouinensis]|uniref:Hydrogenase cytochrome b-type subunit, membrane protein-like protein n=1 Tax=Ramlibacter tataouinensis (strain ATCC BAA-407 / DSM 14655 / LMG 21543 / TTB310) TaxID=365046 RepID=F5Y598_RAMTT|nr:cytochrome b/b6 domain-containing protein [Ramlibacter tataouinensis]AEG91408.1 hydrogenase cytochrome b-type subunit, membrane protein-like protein [Ramlibacter tataouinensis TTB310]
MQEGGRNNTVRVWDLPTRFFHWALVLCVAGLFLTAYLPGSQIEWHARLGYAVLALLLFRLAWGVVGGRWSRFASFLYAPSSVVNYLRGRAHPDHLIGHNPLGAASVLAMLLALLAQVATGLVGDDEIAFTGPLNRFVPTDLGLAATWFHKDVGQWILVALVALHVLAILYYLWARKDNLVGPMVHGDKRVARPAASSRDDAVVRVVALLLLALSSAAVYGLVTL